jgi:hypothetical protein
MLMAAWLIPLIGFAFAAEQSTPAAGLSSGDILQFLTQTIGWYRQLEVDRQLAAEPTEVLLVNENEQAASQVVGLAFDFARAAAPALEKQSSSTQEGEQGSNSTRHRALLRLSASLDQQVRETRAEVESMRQKLPAATGPQLRALQTLIAETQSELELAETRRDAMQTMAEFVGGSGANGMVASGLRAEIDELAKSVPSALTTSPTVKGSAPSSEARANTALVAAPWKPAPSGVWGLTEDLLALSRKMGAVAGAMQLTDALAQTSRGLRTPLVTRLREMSSRGDELAKQADSANPSQLSMEKKELDALTAQFKQTSAAVLPLSKQGVLLDLCAGNLTNWQSTLKSQYGTELRNLLFRLAILAVLLAVVFAGAELWRRTIVRYVHDIRRRHQFLLLRRIVTWCVIAVILVMAFANEISSFATFAGLMTAGVAVALQSVILAMAGYFFLIGRFGIKVGDRVNVAGVTGEVLEIGLVRFHLLETAGGGNAPTGRVVAFSNSIVFQSNAGLFKQIPGTNFVWHEITLTLPSGCDYRAAEEQLRGTVEAVFSGYREEMERQHRQMEKTLTLAPIGGLQPKNRLHLTPSGLEIVIGYPVDLVHAAEINDRVTRELLKVIEGDPQFKGAGSAGIQLRADISPPNANAG